MGILTGCSDQFDDLEGEAVEFIKINQILVFLHYTRINVSTLFTSLTLTSTIVVTTKKLRRVLSKN